MDPNLLLATVGLAYVGVFGLLAILRREGVSTQFIAEGLALTALIAGAGYLTGSTTNPILFIAALYLITMRARLLVDLANVLSNRGRQRNAIAMLQVGLRLYPDFQTRMIILVNMAMIQLRRENPQSAVDLLTSVLNQAQDGGLGFQLEAAAHYHLGLAYQRLNEDAKAVREFRRATEAFPGSPFAKAARTALEQRRKGRGKSQTPRG